MFSTLNNIIISGLHRSGTTLTCWIINQAENSVALNEPMSVREMFPLTPEENVKLVENYFEHERAVILRSKRAAMRQTNQELMTNLYGTELNEKGLRTSIADMGYVSIQKKLNDDFLMAIKHNAAFCALLPALTKRFRCLGIIRNPLAVMLSWQSVDISVRSGRIPVGQTLDKKLNERLEACNSVIDKQLIILEWYFDRFRKHLPNGDILKYEDIIHTNGLQLYNALQIIPSMHIDLKNKNFNPLYPIQNIKNLTSRLIEKSYIFEGYYSEEEIIQLAELYM